MPRPDHEERLPAGSTLLFHTDGLIEHPGQSLDHGMDQAAGIAATHAKAPLPELCDALLASLNSTFHDDVALLAVRLLP